MTVKKATEVKDNKTIKVSLYFHTNDLKVERKGKPVVSCWDNGKLTVVANASKGIKNPETVPFNGLADIIPLIKEELKKHTILMVSDNGKPRTMNLKRKL